MFGHKTQTINVHVKSDLKDYVVTNKPLILDGTRFFVRMRESTEKTAEWKVEATGCIRTNRFGPYIEVFEGEPKAIKFDMATRNVTFPTLTENEKQEILNLKIFKAHYGKLLGDLLQAIKPYIFVMIGIGIGAIVCAGLSAYFAYQANNMVQNYYLVK